MTGRSALSAAEVTARGPGAPAGKLTVVKSAGGSYSGAQSVAKLTPPQVVADSASMRGLR